MKSIAFIIPWIGKFPNRKNMIFATKSVLATKYLKDKEIEEEIFRFFWKHYMYQCA